MHAKAPKKSAARRFLALLLALSLPSSFVRAQDAQISPLSPSPQAESPPSRSVEYTEDLYQVTDSGIYSQSGEYVSPQELPVPPAASVAPESGPSPSPNLSAPSPSAAAEPASASFEDYRKTLIESWIGQNFFTQKRLEGVQENIVDQQERFAELDGIIAQAEKELGPLKEQMTTLESQIDLINGQVRVTKDKIASVEMMIAEKQIQIKDLMLELRKGGIELGVQEGIVEDYIRLLYEQEDRYLGADRQSSTVKLLLADASVGENLLGQDYLAVMEQTGRRVFHDLDAQQQELNAKQDAVLKEQQELNHLLEVLRKEKDSLEENRISKKDILEKAQGEEERYQAMLDEAIQEQLQTALAVQSLQSNLAFIEQQLGLMEQGMQKAKSLSEQPLSAPEQIEAAKQELSQIDEQLFAEPQSNELQPFMWPVPFKRITAEFHDPSYPKKWGMHNAIDLAAKQSTEIRAPANAYVFQTKDNGFGYSYVVLAHKGNLVTVYGHVSQILVKPGTFLQAGQVFALSGGTPGTKGAGLQTTGPHLHFEVHYKGKAVNPLDYLPSQDLPGKPTSSPSADKTD